MFPITTLLFLLNSCIALTEIPIHIPFYRLYDNGIFAYNNANWLEAIDYLEWSLLQRELHINSTVICLDECYTANTQCSVDLCQMSNYKEVYLLIKNFHCVKRCKGKLLRSIDYMNGKDYNYSPREQGRLPFISGNIYDHLQYSYYKVGNIDNSTRALRTLLAYNPNNPRAKAGLQFLMSISKRHTISEPRESPFYLSLFNRGWDMYSKMNWVESVNLWESSLRHLLEEIGRCRSTCEDFVAPVSFNLLFSPQYTTLALSVQLRCQFNCYLNTTNIGGYDNILSSLFLYLQYSYYKIQDEDLVKALSAAKTVKLIDPNNDEIEGYLALYSELLGVENTIVGTRPGVRILLDHLQQINSVAFAVNDILPISQSTINPSISEVELTQDSQNFIVGSRSTKPLILLHLTNLPAARILVDNFFSEVECRQLVLLADEASISGDGYFGKKFGTDSSPHTPHENFTGVTLDGALQAWKAGKITKNLLLLYLDMSERTRAYLESYFHIDTRLYFSYTHLVCRTAKEDSDQDNRRDLSHPVHADNCILEEDGSCLKVPPAYTWRDYSCLVYLTHGFEGGDFFFANRRTLEPEVRIATNHPGRMLGFSAGVENLHGVLPLTHGKRCALALWFTLDKAHSEDRELIKSTIS